MRRAWAKLGCLSISFIFDISDESLSKFHESSLLIYRIVYNSVTISSFSWRLIGSPFNSALINLKHREWQLIKTENYLVPNKTKMTKIKKKTQTKTKENKKKLQQKHQQ